eukprot:9954356-Alexandrium_andersonii.AAC.1
MILGMRISMVINMSTRITTILVKSSHMPNNTAETTENHLLHAWPVSKCPIPVSDACRPTPGLTV